MSSSNQPQESGKVWPCAHMKDFECMTICQDGISRYVEPKLCPICGAKPEERPEEVKDELHQIVQNYLELLPLTPKGIADFEKDLRAWKLKNTIPVCSDEYPARMMEEEKPKRLREILRDAEYHLPLKSTAEQIGEGLAEVALDWFEGILPDKNDPKGDSSPHGWISCLAEIRERIERERNG